MNRQQFELNFKNNKNTFCSVLKKGHFSVFFEIQTPTRDCNLSTVLSRLDECKEILQAEKEFHLGFAITDKLYYRDRFNTLDFASELCGEEREKHLIFLSGKGANPGNLLETVEAAKQMGFLNIIPVSGGRLIDENIKDIRNTQFSESVDILKIINDNKGDLFPGSVVNPFKYTPPDLFSQYYKLIKKINMGANFIITQIGWDLLKHQELRWFLESREYYTPSLARILFLKPKLIEQIVSGNYSGIHISPDFLNILRKESKFSYTQFMAAQWRRMQIYTAGLYFLGYSGIVISGIETPLEMRVALKKISEALKEFKNFNDWREAYFNYLARSEMAPYPYRFYIYKNLFSDAYVDSAKESNLVLPEPSKIEKLKYVLSKNLFSDSNVNHKKILFLLKKFSSGCVRCKSEKCYISSTNSICPLQCPKKMRNGPCGDTKADGSCELTNKECIHSRIFKISNWLKVFDVLEERYIPK